MMLITNNSYNILWLPSDSDEKQINKRYKEILNLLNIDEIPEYENDISFVDYKTLRKESYIKEALHRLNNQKKSLYEFFFWFNLVDKEDERCLRAFIKWKYAAVMNKWEKLYDEFHSPHYLKNAVIASLLLYENQEQFPDLDFSEDPKFIVKWLYRLLSSSRFWKEFETMYNMDRTVPVSDELLGEFKEELPQYLTESFFDLGEKLWTNRLYRIFAKKFELVAQELDDNKNVMTPIKKIEKYLEDIRDIDKKTNIKWVFSRVERISQYIEKLDRLGLSNNAKIIKLKDEAANQIIWVSIEISNDNEDYENWIILLNYAKGIAHSESIIVRIDNNIVTLNENIDYKKHWKVTITNDQWEKEKIKVWGKPAIFWTINFCWTTMYWDTLYLVILMIPILPISRWKCESLDWTNYRFYWELELKKWQKIWKYVWLWLIWLRILIASLSSS